MRWLSESWERRGRRWQGLSLEQVLGEHHPLYQMMTETLIQEGKGYSIRTGIEEGAKRACG